MLVDTQKLVASEIFIVNSIIFVYDPPVTMMKNTIFKSLLYPKLLRPIRPVRTSTLEKYDTAASMHKHAFAGRNTQQSGIFLRPPGSGLAVTVLVASIFKSDIYNRRLMRDDCPPPVT